MLRAARETGMEIVWDIFHFGWPEDLDIFQPAFVRRLTGLAEAFARLLRTMALSGRASCRSTSRPSWRGAAATWPASSVRQGPGRELKAQLTLAALAVMECVHKVLPRARFILIDR
jgi:hypothetical protein